MAKDLDLFKAAMTGVTPLKGQRVSARPVSAEAVAQGGERKKEAPISSPVLRRGVGEREGGFAFDRDIDRALSRGQRAPEAKLDLHGLTLAAAERAVVHFLADSAARGLRVVLIVTGKGLRLEGGKVFGGRIRAEFPAWLERPDNRALVAGMRAAHPRHGGTGAFYVLLRRRSPRALA